MTSRAADDHHGLFDDVDHPAPLDDQSTLDDEPQPLDGVNNTEDPTDEGNDTIATNMIIFFLVLMVLYVGFCFYHRRVKVRWSVDDATASERRRRRRANQDVLDESARRAGRARNDEEARVKLEELPQLSNFSAALDGDRDRWDGEGGADAGEEVGDDGGELFCPLV